MFRIKQITGHPNYAISDDGKYVYNIISGNILSQQINNHGYHMVTLTNGKGMQVHRLVAMMFVQNPYPEKFDQVNHKFGDKSDNRFQSLEWTDNSGNQLHAYRIGLQPKILGEAKHNARLTNEEVHSICKVLQENPHWGGRSVQKHLGFVNMADIITRIKNRSNWLHISVGYTW